VLCSGIVIQPQGLRKFYEQTAVGISETSGSGNESGRYYVSGNAYR